VSVENACNEALFFHSFILFSDADYIASTV